MVLIVNGERRETEARRIAALLAELEFTGTQLAIAVNRGVVPRTRWSDVELRDGDAIEIISPRQGG
jgi:sulfur carrier protein